MGSKFNIFMLAEDPGGANCIVSLQRELAKVGRARIRLFGNGPAQKVFSNAGLSFENADMAFQQLKKIKPDLLVLATSEDPNSSDKKLFLSATAAKIKTVYVIDYWTNLHTRLSDPEGKNPLYYKPDYLIVIDSRMKKEYVNLGFPKDKILISGHLHLNSILDGTDHINRPSEDRIRRIFPGISLDSPILLFASETLGGGDEFERSCDYTLNGWGDTNARTLIVLEELIDACESAAPNVQIVVRPHPKNNINEFNGISRHVTCFNTDSSALEACMAADLVAGMTSMLLLEALALGRPVLSIIPRQKEKDWLPGGLSDALVCCWTKRQITESLKSYFEGKAVYANLAKKNKNRIFRERSSGNLSKIIFEIIENKN